ncbi:hypothetical protein GTP46_05000 [Duganella sp. FT135W]|uniref:Uncharacterized protein n=1 Tax=Duganella flavida TaxID=2692175 RepID=A0A6L8K452_9BURK|nr:hypothetical protein [Duganella flavida]MYM22000.1 hypothetical protein [Duganella flavida]
MAILKTALCAAVLASPLAAPVVDWVVERIAPAADQILFAQAFVPPPIDLGKLGQAFRH